METGVPNLDRVIFNFTGRCNMACQFCYIPFDGSTSELSLWEKIISQCKSWHPKMFTFGGGDPFLYENFRMLLQHVSEEGIFIHVDTNAIALRQKDIAIIKQHVNQVGLPFDGTERVHNQLRGLSTHFNIVNRWLVKLLNENINVKVNTMVTKLNSHGLGDLARFLEQFPLRQWCLYQYWPIAWGSRNRYIFGLADEEFFDATEPIRENFKFTHIDIASTRDRLFGHFFVTHTGIVYSESRDNPEEYVVLGSVFDKNTMEKWRKHGNPLTVAKRADLRINPGQRERSR